VHYLKIKLVADIARIVDWSGRYETPAGEEVMGDPGGA